MEIVTIYSFTSLLDLIRKVPYVVYVTTVNIIYFRLILELIGQAEGFEVFRRKWVRIGK